MGITRIKNNQISSHCIKNTDFENVPANTIKGRVDDEPGNLEDLTPEEVRKLLKIEEGADKTCKKTVEDSGAVMESDISTEKMKFVLNEETFESNAENKLATQKSIKTYVDAAIESTLKFDVPIGTLLLYSGETQPLNFLIADGQEVSRKTYKELFKVIGTSFGHGDGINTFIIPKYLTNDDKIKYIIRVI